MSIHEHFPLGSILKRDLDGGMGLLYSHMGIYAGSGRVIHLDGKVAGKAKSGGSPSIKEISYEEFCKGKGCRLQKAPDCTDHGLSVVAEARRLLRDPSGWNGHYCLLTRNCEDFTTHCFEKPYQSASATRKGSTPSSQRTRSGVTLAGIAVGSVALLLTGGKFKASLFRP